MGTSNKMNNKIIDILAEISDQYGDMVFYNHQKTKNLLSDLAPGMQKERIHVVQFLEINGYFQLKYAGHSYPIVRTRLAQSYINTYGVHDDVAIWVLDVFSQLLGYADFMNMQQIIKTDENDVEDSIEDNAVPEDNTQDDDEEGIRERARRRTKEKFSEELPPKIPSAADLAPLLQETPIIPVPRTPIRPAGIKPNAPNQTISIIRRTFDLKTRIAADTHTVAVLPDGTVKAVGVNDEGQCLVSKWQDIVAVSCGPHFTIGLRSDGRVVAAGQNKYGQCNVGSWRDIVAISCGARHTVGLKNDGTLVATGQNRNGECSITNWRNVIHISAGYQCTFGIKSDYTVLAKGNVKWDENYVANLDGILNIANPYPYRAMALKTNGRLSLLDPKDPLSENINKWKGLKQISAGPDYFAGLFKDGRVRILAYYWVSSGVECSPNDWSDIAAIAAGRFHLLGVKNDGSIKAVMMHPSKTRDKGQCRVGGWKLI